MSYDIRFAVKGIDEKMYVVFEPEYDSPTYNLRDMFVNACEWTYKQGEWYAVKDVIGNIEKGIHNLTFNRHKFEKYNSPNGFGTVGSALECLESIHKCLDEHLNQGWDWNEYTLENLYMSW